MRRTITQYGGKSKSELREFLPSVIVKHPRYDYYLGADLKHASTSTQRGIGVDSDFSIDRFQLIFGKKEFDYEVYSN